MDGEADRKKSNCFSAIPARELCFYLRKCVFLYSIKNKCIFLQKKVFYNKSDRGNTLTLDRVVGLK